MTSARRIYLYAASAISLQVLTWGTISLLRNMAAAPVEREAAAFQVAVIVVALPIFVAHWAAVGRAVRGSEVERSSLARHAYLYGMTAVWLLPAVANLHGLLARAIGWVVGSPSSTRPGGESTGVGEPLLALLVLCTLCAYHARLLRAEGAWRSTDAGPTAVRRLFLHGFAALGALLTALSAVQLLGLTIISAVSGVSGAGRPGAVLVGATARLVVGLLVWLPAGWAASKLYRQDRPGERQSLLRGLYVHGFSLVGMVVTLGVTAVLLSGGLRRLLGVRVEGTPAIPIAVIAVGACGWLLHSLIAREDAALRPPEARPRAVERVRRYAVAAVSLAAVIGAAAAVIQVILRSALDAAAAEALRSQLAWGTAFLLVGIPPWTVAWWSSQRIARSDGPEGAAERAATSRRAYLYFYLLVATTIVLSGAVYVVFRLLAAALGIAGDAGTPSRLAEAVAYALVGAGLWALHARAVRADDVRADEERSARLRFFRAVVLDPGDWPAGRAILDALRAQLPGMAVERLELDSAEATASAGARSGEGDPTEAEAAAAMTDFLIAPWPTERAAAQIARIQASCHGVTLLVAENASGWGWVGIEPLEPAEAARQAVHAMRQLLDCEPLSPARSWGPLHLVGMAVLGLLAFFTVIVPIATFVMGGGFLRLLAP